MSSTSSHAIDQCKVQEMQFYPWKSNDKLILKKVSHVY